LAALKVYDVGKPVVIEETFPLSCGQAEFETFIDASRERVDGYIGFYWGKTIDEYSRPDVGIAGAIMRTWLEYFRTQGPAIVNRRDGNGLPITP
jgi:hypothetical protein